MREMLGYLSADSCRKVWEESGFKDWLHSPYGRVGISLNQVHGLINIHILKSLQLPIVFKS